MKKRILSIIMIITTLLCSNVFAMEIFNDVSSTHWALSYIYRAQYENIINGYGDGTFKPENQVKTGEFIKMVAMALYPRYEVKSFKDREHWSTQYVELLDRRVLMARDYDDARLERVITRAEAARILCMLYVSYNSNAKLDMKLEYINNFTDASLITQEADKIAIDDCVRFGLINGFEDGSFKPNDGLTRAQAAKILCLAIGIN